MDALIAIGVVAVWVTVAVVALKRAYDSGRPCK